MLFRSSDIHAVVRHADVLVLAVPSAFLKGAMDQLDKTELQGKTIFSAVKGIVPETNQIVGEFLFQHWGIATHDFGVICGPCHAEEVAMERLSYLTIASQNRSNAAAMSAALNGRFLKTTLSDDIYGTEYGAILKNVVAVCAGISVGLGYGDNFRAVLVSRAIQEIARFVAAVHPIDRDINEPAYLGDLLVTAYSTFSRNREFGEQVGAGKSVGELLAGRKTVVEGHRSTAALHGLCRERGITAPILAEVHAILYENKKPADALHALMTRELMRETASPFPKK